MNVFKSYRIDRVLFGFFSSFFILLLTAVVWIGYTFSANALASNATRYQQDLLLQINNQLSQQLASIEQMSLTAARTFVTSEYVSNTDEEYGRYLLFNQFSKYLAQLTYSSPALDSIEFYLMNEENVTAANPFAARIYGPDALFSRSWYTSVEQADSVWIEPHQLLTPKGPVEVISYAIKVYSNSGNVIGILVFHVKSSFLESMMKGEQELRDGVSRIWLNSSGMPMISIGDSLSSGAITAIREQMKDPIGGARVEYVSDGKSEDHLAVWIQTLSSGWMLIEVTPWAQITLGSRRLAHALLAAGGAAAVLAVLYSLLLSKYFTRPIGLLLSAMNAFSIGKEPDKLPMDYRNEFGVLFHGFRKLTNRVSELYASLQEEYRRKREAELTALQANINPHFLYNTLDQLNWMAVDAGQDQISRALELLGRMLRLGLSNGERFITLKEEMEYLRCYLEIQRIRFGDQLQYQMDLPEQAAMFFVPKLTLQPFVENSIIHGFHGRDGGTIAVEAWKHGEKLMIRIQDNGRGISADWRKPKGRASGGYGIRNVEERLNVYFGNEASVNISARAEGGAEAVIVMPALNQKPDASERSKG